MSDHVLLLRLLGRTARRLEARRVSLGASETSFCALVSSGGRLRRRVVQYADGPPSVMERAEQRHSGMLIVAHRPIRLATAGEMCALKTTEPYFHLGSYIGADLPGDAAVPPLSPRRKGSGTSSR